MPFSNCGEYLVEKEFGTTVTENLFKTSVALEKELFSEYIYDNIKYHYLNSY